ncbi:MAG: lipid II flippase MurJ, partial [Mycobacteriales bacterium]
AVTLLLANGRGVPVGRMTAFTFAQTMFLLPWAILAVPIATSVFPQLASRWETGDRAGYLRSIAGSLRAVLLVCALATAALIAAARPAARVLLQGAPGQSSVTPLAVGIAALAPGLLGYGLYALLSRALYAQGKTWQTAVSTLAGWASVIVADLILAQLLPAADRVLALAIGNSIGMTVLGVLLLGAIGRRSGRPAFAGIGRSAVAALIGGALATGAGLVVARTIAGGGIAAALGQLVLVCCVVLLVFGAVAWWLCGPDIRALVGRRGPIDA